MFLLLQIYELFPCAPYPGRNGGSIQSESYWSGVLMGVEMIVFVQREPQPDAPYWSGRRWLAALDAVAWPLALAMLVLQVPDVGRGTGMVWFVAAVFAVFRLCGALFSNHRYWFTTWWMARAVALLLAVGLLMKLAFWVAASH